MEGEMTIGEFAAELRRGARAVLQVRHAARPKIDHDDPTFGDRLPITEAGMATALRFGAMLAEFRDDVTFVSSPLRRTRMTAAAIAEGMGVEAPAIPVDELLGNGSFYYDDPLIVLKVFKERDFFEACCEYYATGNLPGFRPLAASADRCERWLLERLERRLLIASTHDCYIAALLAARGAIPQFSRANWPRFLDSAAILVYPDGSRRYALVRAGLSDGICGVAAES